ncbi:MAG: eukaryotic-like serine/threonine-protein kinase [Candidatus Binatota bacterium]|nr:eukaryotic-like serine/threonine-protein kinase [Candidatus Binatota bacterium]
MADDKTRPDFDPDKTVVDFPVPRKPDPEATGVERQPEPAKPAEPPQPPNVPEPKAPKATKPPKERRARERKAPKDRAPSDDTERTVVMSRGPELPPSIVAEPPADPATAEPEAPTVMMSRAPAGAPPTPEARPPAAASPPAGAAGASDERTLIRPAADAAAAAAADRTFVRTEAAARIEAASAHELVCLAGPAHGRRFPVPARGAVIGSSPTCTIVVPGLQSVHAKIDSERGGFSVLNLGTPGSIVASGGRRAERLTISSGDLVKLDQIVLRLAGPGEVFSSEYSDADFAPSGFAGVLSAESLAKNRLWIAIAVLALIVIVLFLLPSGDEPRGPVKVASGAAPSDRAKQIESLLASGKTLFEEGRLFAPPDRPGAENAFDKFNEVLVLEPGNAQALGWLKRIDAERDRERRAREEEDQRRRAREQELRERARRELEARVNAELAEGDRLFDRGQAAEPAGKNALVHYRQALAIDPESAPAKQREDRVVAYYVDRGDAARERDDPWAALENYRKASRVTGGKDPEVESRVREIETRLSAGMAGTGATLIMYKDERGHLFVFDDMDKVPSRYRDRAVTVKPSAPSGSAG